MSQAPSRSAGSAGTPLVSIAGIEQGVATLVINHPPVNSYSPQVAEALDTCFNQCIANDQIKAIIITGAGKIFVAGADIPNLLRLSRSGDLSAQKQFFQRAHAVVNQIEHSPKPVIAAINGDALGGGCELAMACHARIATKQAKLGLPELKLGIIPGMGGTQRLPRLVGPDEAIKMILSSKSVAGPRAQKLGLVDVVVNKPDELIPAATKYAQGLIAGKIPRVITSELKKKIPSPEEITALTAMTRVQTKKKSRNVIHPLLAIDAVEKGLLEGANAGFNAEIDKFMECLAHPAANALLGFFLASKATARVPGIDLKTAKPIKSVGILGGGTMGAGIAICFLMKGIPVRLKEVNDKFLRAGVERILADITTIVQARKMNPMVIEYMMRGLTPQLTYDGFDKLDLVIEAVIEDIPLKQSIFADLAKICSPTCILATNTSTINIETVIEKVSQIAPRVIGLHFFSPAHIMPLLEIIRTKHTAPEVVASSVVLAKTIMKTPVVVGNCVGFVANRVFFPYGMAGNLLVAAGKCPYQIDAALMAFGMPMGIFRMNDSVGVDLGIHIGPIFEKAYSDRVYMTKLSQYMVDAKRFGQKSNVGFYKYLVPRKPSQDVAGLTPILQKVRQDAVAAGGLPDASKLSAQDIVEICIFPVINECARTLAEGYASSPTDVDVISVMGYGFPAYRGGLMTYGRQIGFDVVARRLEHWAQFFPKQRGFFEPSKPLLALATNKQ